MEGSLEARGGRNSETALYFKKRGGPLARRRGGGRGGGGASWAFAAGNGDVFQMRAGGSLTTQGGRRNLI